MKYKNFLAKKFFPTPKSKKVENFALWPTFQQTITFLFLKIHL